MRKVILYIAMSLDGYMSPDEWIYSTLTSYIITNKALPSTENIRFVQDDPCCIVQKLKKESGQGIWICGEYFKGLPAFCCKKP